jgi:hypothetical protein
MTRFGRPLSDTGCCEDSPLHRCDYLLSVGPLFGYRSVSEFAVELANRFLDDPRFDFVDHVLTVHVQADALIEPFAGQRDICDSNVYCVQL